MKQIDISTKKYPNTFTSVDDADFNELNKHKWCRDGRGYVVRNQLKRRGVVTIFMHRTIVGTPKGMHTDHKDGDKLKNTRANLRACTTAQNGRNRKPNRNNTSGFKGVYWSKHAKKWQAHIMVNRKTINLGYFFCIVKAARAYDKAAKKYHGEFAYTNYYGEL